MAKNKKGIEKKEYPKLVKVGDKKVRVLSEEDEAKLSAKPEKKAPTGWDK